MPRKPKPTPTPVPPPPPPPPPSTSSFVGRCGLSLCLGGSRWYLYGASDLTGLDSPETWSSMAVAGGLNTIRIVNFLDENGSSGTAAYDEWHWQRVDRVIASARSHGLHVLLDLSTYRNLLKHSGVDPYALDWQPFLSFVANRTNTVTGATYASDPTIALVAFAGEVEPINSGANTLGVTTTELTTFYARTFSEWKALDPNHLVSPGGFLQIDWNSGIDWRAIFGLADNDVCSIHNYSSKDTSITTPNVSAYCASIGRPWITEEFGWEQSIGDSARAVNFQSMYTLQVANGSAGVAFWNLGAQVGGSTYDVNSSTPLTWGVVQRNAPGQVT